MNAWKIVLLTLFSVHALVATMRRVNEVHAKEGGTNAVGAFIGCCIWYGGIITLIVFAE